MTVTVTLQANALTTLEVVLAELDLTSDGAAQDSRLNRYINAASDLLAQRCNRVFQRSNAIVEKRRGYGSTILYVTRPPIVAITTVSIDDAEIDSDGYEIEDANAGRLFRAAGWPWAPASGGGLVGAPVPGSEDRNVSVTYNGGFVTRPQAAVGGAFAGQTVTLPADLEDACVVLVTQRERKRGRDPTIASESIQSASVAYVAGADGALPAEVAATIERYARIANA